MIEKEKSLFRSYKISLLVACELILAFSGIGYFMPLGGSAVMLYIPVIAAAYFYGCGTGAFLGAVFGFTSIVKSSMSVETVGFFNTLFSPFLSGNVAGSLCVALGARILFGFTAGVLFSIAKKINANEYIKVAIVSSASHILHTVFVFTFMGYFFPETNVNSSHIIGKIFSVREIMVDSIIVAVMFLIMYISKNNKVIKIQQILRESRQAFYFKRLKKESIIIVSSSVIVLMVLLVHLYVRMYGIISADDANISLNAEKMLINLQFQFLIGLFAFLHIMATIFISYRLYSYYQVENSNKDSMTGLYNKATAMNYGAAIIDKKRFPNAYFVMLDIDNFKSINDTYGHLTGDKVIINIARFLAQYFNHHGLVSRFGGDEFAVFITRHLNRQDIEKRIKDFQSDVASISFDNNGMVTCSIGVVHISNEKNFDEIYKKADEMLYHVKVAGRNGYKFYENI